MVWAWSVKTHHAVEMALYFRSLTGENDFVASTRSFVIIDTANQIVVKTSIVTTTIATITKTITVVAVTSEICHHNNSGLPRL